MLLLVVDVTLVRFKARLNKPSQHFALLAVWHFFSVCNTLSSKITEDFVLA
jgi:hypothetical protein